MTEIIFYDLLKQFKLRYLLIKVIFNILKIQQIFILMLLFKNKTLKSDYIIDYYIVL